MSYTPTHPQAIAAIRAATLRPRIGHWASWRYCQKRGVHMNLYIIACVLENAARGGLTMGAGS